MVSHVPRVLLALGALTLLLAFLLMASQERMGFSECARELPLICWGLGLVLLGLVFWMFTPDRGIVPASEPGPESEPEAWLCKHCLKPYVPGAHFCPRCACPQTFFAAVAQYEQVYAVAWCLGRAAHHPTHRIHLVGILLSAISSALYGYFELFSLSDLAVATPLTTVGMGLLGCAYAYVFGALLWIAVASWRRRARGEPPPEPAIEYGTTPWWTYDADWALPEFEATDEEPEVAPGT